MDSKEDQNADDHRHNMATENSDTIAMQKKRARRVSFAETTSIHLFNRDEDDDGTPLIETSTLRDDSPGGFDFVRQPEPNMKYEGDDGDSENDEDEEMNMHKAFLRPIGSPSPGGSTFGSASSNDEDNFFGPVSANFIRPGRLSDSAASDDNHDLTMDSTAFSMHYRSLARSESGVDLKTPTDGQLFFEEKTPMNENNGSSMIITLGKKPIPQFSLHVTEISGSHSSNDMSLVGENSSKYDFEKLSPRLDALLGESRNDLLHVSVSADIITSSPHKPKEPEIFPSIDHGNNFINPSDYLREEKACISVDVLNEGESAAHTEVDEANGHHITSPCASSPESSNLLGAAASKRDNDKPTKSQYQLSQDGSETPVVSASSLAERHQIILTGVSPSKQWELASPLPRPGSILRNESVEHQATETSVRRSISKLDLLERATFSSAYSAKVDNSFARTLNFFKSPNVDPLLGGNFHKSRINVVEDSVTDEKVHSIHQSKERNYSSSKDRALPETPNHISDEISVKGDLGRKVGEKSPHPLKAENISRDQTDYGGPASSPSKIACSGENLMRNLFTSRYSNEDAVMTENEFLLTETSSGDGAKAILAPEFVSSPDGRLGKKFSASPCHTFTESIDLVLQKQISDFYKDRELTPGGDFVNANLSTATGNSVVEAISPKNLTEIQAPGYGDYDIDNGKEIFGTIGNFGTLAKERRSQILDSEDLDLGGLAWRGVSRSENSLPERDPSADCDGSVSPSACGNLNESRLQKNLVELPTASPSREEHDNEQSSAVPSPKTTHRSGRPEQVSGSKRNVELLLRDTQHRVAMTLMQRSPKLWKGGNSGPETMSHQSKGGTPFIVYEKKKWTDTYSKFLEDLKNTVSGSTHKLNSKTIDALETGLVHLQRSKAYQMLHHGVISQNSYAAHDCQLEKIAETNSLLHRVVFEKTKLQLGHVKKERLLEKLQLLSSRIQKSHKLGENIASQSLQRCTNNFVVDAVGDRTLSINLVKGHEVCHEKLTTMRQALDTLDKKILNLTRTFHACCKIKAEPSCDDTIALVNKHLTERASFRFIRLEMQMWVIHCVGKENDQNYVILNYLDFIIQSINILVGPAPSVSSTSYKLNEANILKNFPNMDACIAFAFVFNAGTASKYIGAKTLPHETQVTSSLLGTLLDVVEEVQLAQVEFQNLIQSRFLSPSVDRLDLMLYFYSFTTGRKLTLTLDMSCLKHGIYPYEMVPLLLASPGDSKENSSSPLIFDEIKEAVKGVRTGYLRILRLCKCVAEVVGA
ncbi:hypothetical protein OROGR_015461 [Orobanche gracilis]